MGNILPIKQVPLRNSEECVCYLATLMIKDMWSYILPYARRLIPSKVTSTSKWLQQRQYIATHVKSVFEKVKVYVISNEKLCSELVAQQMYRHDNPVQFIGLDCEWESRKKDGIALLQVSSGSDCILYRVCQTDNVIPANLKKLLEDRKVLKFGVGIEEDVRRLRLHGVLVKGFVDLRNLAHRCVPTSNQEYSPEEEL
jgi:3''-5'' exonuclease.